jgi:two-component system CheB/CheR fusion protein
VDAVVPLSMAFHELTTNALKYGALSVDGGHVDISWQLLNRDQMVELLWQEINGQSRARKNIRIWDVADRSRSQA